MSGRAFSAGIALFFVGCGLSVVGVDPGAGGVGAEAGVVPGDGAATSGDGGGLVDTGADDRPLCDAPSLACCGRGACPAGSTECINGACFVSIDIAARVDGSDDLRLKGDTAQWQHLSYQEPSSLKLNGATWTVNFPNNYDGDTCNACFGTPTKPLAPPVAAHAQAGILDKSSGRGRVTLSPATAANGFTLVVHFADPDSSAANYTATVKYETR